MSSFADTNFLVPLYLHHEQNTPVVTRFSRRLNEPLLVSPMVLLEARNAISRISQAQDSAGWQKLRDDVGVSVELCATNWAEVEDAAERIVDRFAHKAAIDSADCLVLGAAQLAGAELFCSFDTGSACRALASALGFKVFPNLAAKDRQILNRLRR